MHEPKGSAIAATLEDLFRSGAALVHCDAVEDWSLVPLCLNLRGDPTVWEWSVTRGLKRRGPLEGSAPGTAQPPRSPEAPEELEATLRRLLRKGEPANPMESATSWILILRDAVGTEPLSSLAVRLFKDLYVTLTKAMERVPRRMMILFTGRGWTPPPALAGLVVPLTLPLPTEREIVALAPNGVPPLQAEEFASRARGLRDPALRFLLSQLRSTPHSREEAIQRVNDAKSQGIRSTQILDIALELPAVTLGGFERFQVWFQTRKPFFMNPINPALQPRGVLLLGFPGCGKSHAARWVAHQLNVPLVTMDIGRIQDRWVGSSEARMREALMTLDAAAPVVLFLDEIEKAIAGNQSDSSGVTTRLVGQLLTWLQDRKRPIFVVATCNEPKIPPELSRAGRFDALFVVRPPNDRERASILDAVAKEVGVRLPDDVREYVLGNTGPPGAGFTGAELRQLVVEASYHAGHGVVALTMESIRNAFPYVSPLVRRPEGKELLRRYSQESIEGYQEASENL